MNYKKNNTADFELKNWLKINSSQLLLLGIPEPILKSSHRWNHLLDHGYDVETDWDLSQLTNAEARLLLTTLEAQFPKDSWTCMGDLGGSVNKP